MNGLTFFVIFMTWFLSCLYLRTIDSGWYWILGPVGLIIELVKRTMWCVKGKSFKYFKDF